MAPFKKWCTISFSGSNLLHDIRSNQCVEIGEQSYTMVSKGQRLTYIHDSRWLVIVLFTRFLLYVLCSVQFSEYFRWPIELTSSSYSDFFCIPIVGVVGYYSTCWHSVTQHYNIMQWHKHTHTRWDASGRVIGPSHRPLPDNTQHLHASQGFEPEIAANEWA